MELSDAAPARRRARLAPRRAGLVNIWDYTQQTFAFSDGRLILRGHNGSGKTTALEVIFPLLLDGRTDPFRLNPFGAGRSIKDHVLHGRDRAGYGYVWLELGDGLGDDEGDGTDGDDGEHVTLGMGLHARPERDRPTTWFFVAEGRVGRDFALLSDDGRPHTREALAKELAGRGEVFRRAQDYRAAVDRRLFSLGAERYDAMVELLLQLRRPKLTEYLNPERLADVLRASLRPLDAELVERAAETFDDLERAQREVDRLRELDQAVQRFLTTYRSYLRAHARERLDRFDIAELRRVGAETAAREAERARDTAREAERARRDERDALGRAVEAKRGETDVLRSSEAFRAHGQLSLLERQEAAARERLREALGARDEARRRLDALTAEHGTARDALVSAESERERAGERLAAAGREASVDDGAAGARALAAEPDALAARLDGQHERRRRDLAAVRARLAEATGAERSARDAEDAAAEAAERRDAVAARVGEAERTLAGARDALAAALAPWAEACAAGTLDDGDVAALAEAARVAGEPGVPTLAERFAERSRARRDAWLAERHALAAELARLEGALAERVARRDAIAAERDDAPPAPHTRGASREGRPGAPLWRLVRFADGLDPAEAALVEAGLEASGLLDAWVWPDGALPPQATDDSALTANPLAGGAASDTSGAAASTLADVLVPEDGAAVARDVVARILASVPLGDADVSIGRDGRFRLGPLAGAHGKDAPEYVGATARAAHRRRRIALLEEEIAAVGAERDARARDAEALAARLTALDAAAGSLPSADAALEALARRDRAAGELVQATQAHADACERLRAAAEAARAARRALDEEARARRLPTDAPGLDRAGEALEAFRRAGAALVESCRAVLRADVRVREIAARLEEARATAERAIRQHDERLSEHDELTAQVRALRETMGADIREVLDRLERCEAEVRSGVGELRALGEALESAIARAAESEAAVTVARERLAEAGLAVDAAADALEAVARPDVLALLEGGAALARSAAPGTAAAWARRVRDGFEAATEGLSSRPDWLKNVTSQVRRGLDELRTALGTRAQLDWELDARAENLLVARVLDEHNPDGSLAGFGEHTSTQLAERQHLLTERERHVLEETMLRSLAAQIHERLSRARDRVREMNVELRRRRTSSGMGVSIHWQRADDVPLPRETLELFEQHPANLRPDQLATLRGWVVGEVKARHAEDPGVPYREQLARVLDYRAWHRFTFALERRGAPAEPLTRKRHAKLSGGERVVVMYLPLFAAANVLFESASPRCPRLVAMDEAFEGCDDVAQASLFELLVAFDLDIFLTGARLWGTFPGVPSVAHYDLVHDDAAGVVSALRLVWDGRVLHQHDVPTDEDRDGAPALL